MKIKELTIMSLDFSSPKKYKLTGRAQEILQSEKIYRFSSLLTLGDVSYDIVLAQGENVREQLQNVKALYSYNSIGEQNGSAMMYLSPHLEVTDVMVSSYGVYGRLSLENSYVNVFSVNLQNQKDICCFFDRYKQEYGECLIGGVFPSDDEAWRFRSIVGVEDAISYPYLSSGNVYRLFSADNFSVDGYYLFDGYFNGLALHPTIICKVKKLKAGL